MGLIAITSSLGRLMAPLWVSVSYFYTKNDWAGSAVFAEAAGTQGVGLVVMAVGAVCIYRTLALQAAANQDQQFALRRLPSTSEQL